MLRVLTAAALGLAIAGPAALAAPCRPTISVAAIRETPAQFALTLVAPCAPYAAVELAYGPLRVTEELSATGMLSLSLPRLPRINRVGAALDGASLAAAVPDGPDAGEAFAAIDWGDGPRHGRLQAGSVASLGFRGSDGAAHLDLAVGGAIGLVIPVTPENCGSSLSLRTALPGMEAPETMVIAMPDCAAAGASLRVPLGGSG